MLKDLRNLSDAEQQEYLDRFIMANEEQKFLKRLWHFI